MPFENRYVAFQNARQEKQKKYATYGGALQSPGTQPTRIINHLKLGHSYCRLMIKLMISDAICLSCDIYRHLSGAIYHLTPEKRQKERDNIQHILLSNKYNDSLEKFNNGKGQKQDNLRNKWAKFTYIGKETRFITEMFKDTDVKIAFTAENSIGKRLTIKQGTPQNTYDRNGIYQLRWPECLMKYMGQTIQSQVPRTPERLQVQ
jgi:hypothetical protein